MTTCLICGDDYNESAGGCPTCLAGSCETNDGSKSAASVGSQAMVDDALTVQDMRIAAAVRKWGLDVDGILREFVGEVGQREKALAVHENISL